MACGCTSLKDGATTSSPHLCIKPSSGECRLATSYSHHGLPVCSSSDYTPCANMPGVASSSSCQDTSGAWASKKCAKKARKGKCHKRKVRANCKATCNLCPATTG
jgi:hypothetical protein